MTTFKAPSNYGDLVSVIKAERDELIAKARILQLSLDRYDDLLEHLTSLFGEAPAGQTAASKAEDKARFLMLIEDAARAAHPQGIRIPEYAANWGISSQKASKLAQLIPSLQYDGNLWFWIPAE